MSSILASFRDVPLKLALPKFAPLRSAQSKSAFSKLAFPKFAFLKSAQLKLIPLKSTPLKSTPLKSVSLRSNSSPLALLIILATKRILFGSASSFLKPSGETLKVIFILPFSILAIVAFLSPEIIIRDFNKSFRFLESFKKLFISPGKVILNCPLTVSNVIEV